MASDAEALTTTLAYAVLPDQVQWLFVLRDFTLLREPVRRVKARTAREIVPRIFLPGPLWQPAFAEDRPPDRAAAEASAAAIIRAPVRHGHADRAGDWPHWDTALPDVLEALAAEEALR